MACFCPSNESRLLARSRFLRLCSDPPGSAPDFATAVGVLPARPPEQPEGLTSLDLLLVCYSWITGISDVAIVGFVRKRVPEIQYLLTSITEEQRQEFGQLIEATAPQIETAQFPSHPGIRFPQNGCVSCPHLGLCIGNEALVGTKLIRQPGAADLDWLDVLDD